MSTQHDLVIIGAGPGGYAAAFHAADMGMKVVLIDTEANPGGVCLYRGCMPTKALLHIAHIKHEALAAKQHGLDFGAPVLDLDALRAWKEEVVNKLTGGLGQLAKRRGVQYIKGTAAFVSSDMIEIKETKEQITFAHTIIATGSRIIDLLQFPRSSRIIDSDAALELKDIPNTMLVVGAGFIGLEMSMIYASFGTKVSVVELLPEMLPQIDKDVMTVFEKQAGPMLEEIMLGTKISSVNETANGVEVTFLNEKQETISRLYDKVLVSVGRKPNSDTIGLENTKVKTDTKGFIIVDAQRRTNDTKIFAIGDVIGQPLLAHKASAEGKIAVEAIAGKQVSYAPACIPGVVYTFPEIASVGVTEKQAAQDGMDISVLKFPWAASGKAVATSATNGLTKIIVEKATGKVIGGAIVGAHAGDMIAEIALAIENGLHASDIARTIHPHPTVSETIMEAAELIHGQCTHLFYPKRKA